MTMKERLQRLTRAQRLLANGVPLKIDRDDENAGLLMRQIGGVTESYAFDLKGGRSGYILSLRIVITQVLFTIAEITLELPWTNHGLSLIDDPRTSGVRYDQYWFPHNRTLAFERGAVINHFVNVQRPLRRGKTLEGLLLCVGSESIPEAFVHGVQFPGSVIVLDQYDNQYSTEVIFWADRSELAVGNERNRVSRPGLFSKRDPSPVHSRSETNTAGQPELRTI
jgi:hypothetical protein